jgi:hypothetical protein
MRFLARVDTLRDAYDLLLRGQHGKSLEQAKFCIMAIPQSKRV